MQTEDKNLRLLMQELAFIARHIQTVDGTGADFEVMDEVGMSVESAKRALDEYLLSLQPAMEEIPSGVALPQAA